MESEKKPSNRIVWRSAIVRIYNCNERLPVDQQRVEFREKDESKWIEGIFLKAENMFFIGFEDSGDFMYAWQVKEWKALKILQNNKK